MARGTRSDNAEGLVCVLTLAALTCVAGGSVGIWRQPEDAKMFRIGGALCGEGTDIFVYLWETEREKGKEGERLRANHNLFCFDEHDALLKNLNAGCKKSGLSRSFRDYCRICAEFVDRVPRSALFPPLH